MTPKEFAPRPALLLTRDRVLTGDHRLAHRAAGEAVHRLRRGVNVTAAGWEALDDRDKYLLRMQAVLATRQIDPVFSHESAALVWGLPVIGRWPNTVHLTAGDRPGARSKNGVLWHRSPLLEGEVARINGMFVTSLERTLVDLARSSSFLSAVASLDFGTRPQILLPDGTAHAGISRAQLLERLAAQGPVRGIRSAREAVAFSDNRSGSPGESLSRGQIHLAGFPAPELQVPVGIPGGHTEIADFRWRQKQVSRTLHLFGEFDGYVKYTRDDYLRGRGIEDVVWAEKLREDRMRAHQDARHRPGEVNTMARWTWDVALHRNQLRTVLLTAGLRPER
jgi:hypothetical protein